MYEPFTERFFKEPRIVGWHLCWKPFILKSVAAAFALRMSVRLQAAGERADFSP